MAVAKREMGYEEADGSPPMVPKRRFGYLRDPVFLTVFVLYFVNRFLIKPITFGHIAFFHSYFNDLICIPFWLPVVLWVHRKLGVRNHDGSPTRFELIMHLVVWSIFFEGMAPRMPNLFHSTTGDPWDVAAYAAGTLIAAVLWGSELVPIRWTRRRSS